MTTIKLRQFKGLQDVSPFLIEDNASSLCNDVELKPKGSLASPRGSEKWNTSSLGFINGLYDYRNRRGGQYIVDFYSDDGAGFGSPSIPGGTGIETPDYSGTVDGSTPSSPPAPTPVFTSLRVEIPDTTYNAEDFTITVTALDQFGNTFNKSGTVSISENGLGSLKIDGSAVLNLTMSNGVATTTKATYWYAEDEANVRISALIGAKSGFDNMATKGWTIGVSETLKNNIMYDVEGIDYLNTTTSWLETTVTILTYNGATANISGSDVSPTPTPAGGMTQVGGGSANLTLTSGVATKVLYYRNTDGATRYTDGNVSIAYNFSYSGSSISTTTSHPRVYLYIASVNVVPSSPGTSPFTISIDYNASVGDGTNGNSQVIGPTVVGDRTLNMTNGSGTTGSLTCTPPIYGSSGGYITGRNVSGGSVAWVVN